MAKTYEVEVDVLMSGRFFVEADNEHEARSKVNADFGRDPYYFGRQADVFVRHEITDAFEF